MEQKRILWIILSVVVFVVVVLGAGLIWFRPAVSSTADGSAETQEASEAGFDAIEYIRDGEAFPGIEADPAGEAGNEGFIAVSGEIVYGEDPEAEAETSSEGTGEAGSETAARSPVKEALPDVISAHSPTPAARPPAPVQRTPVPAAAPVRTPQRVLEYWIQAGSFQSTSRAREVKELLDDKGFSAIITTKDVSGTTWFRVRVGPYLNKGEADKFLGWIKDLDGFSESYISEVTVTR